MADPPALDLVNRAIAAEHRGRFDEARDHLRQATAIAQPALALDARLRLGRLCIMGGPPLFGEAETVLTAAHRQAEHEQAPRQTAVVVHLLALLELRRGRHPEALRLLEQDSPAPLQQAAPGPETAQWFHFRGLVAAGQGELTHAERLCFRAYELYQELHHDPGLAEVCDSLAGIFLRRGKTRGALKFVEQSLERKRQLHDRYGEAISLGTQGRIFLLLARYDDARRAFAEDLAIARELNDQQGIGIMLNSLGEVALLQRDFAASACYYQENLASERGPHNAMFAEAGLARMHLAAGDVDEASAACDRLGELLRQHPPLPGVAEASTGLRGAVAGRRGDPAEAEQLLTQAIDDLRRQNLALDTIPFLYALRDLYQRQGQTAQAVGVMVQALTLWSEWGAERGVKDVEDWLRTVDSPGLVRLALERHLPEHLVQEILSGRLVATAPRLQPLTVLFSDVRDYTTLSERLAPHALVELLNEWFAEATRAIVQHGGMVDKFMGDAVMALFGVPEKRAAGADAVRAALAMRDALSALNLYQKALGEPQLRIGIGIASGPAVVGFIGSHLRQSYTAIGDVVNVASRLESATKDYQCDILICPHTEAEQAQLGVAETAFLGQLQVKGRKQEVAIYKVLGLRKATGTP
jgi:class 3 adenylate cyclase